MAMRPAEGEDAMNRMAEAFGPAEIGQMVRQAVQLCWVGLAPDRRSTAEVESQVGRIVDRALRDFREDREALGR